MPRAWRFFTLATLGIACAAPIDTGPRGAELPRATPTEVTASEERDGATPDAVIRQLLEVRREEASRRAHTDFGQLGFDDEGFGADPYRVVGLEDGRALGLARGAARLVLFDRDLVPGASARGPRLGSGLAVSGGVAFAVGGLDRRVWRYRVGSQLEPLSPLELPVEYGLDALAAGSSGMLYVTAENDARVYMIDGATGASPRSSAVGTIGRGPHRLELVPGHLLALCRLDHSLVVWELDAAGRPTGKSWRRAHDGPFWGLGALRLPGSEQLLIFATGVEDSPLDRRRGSFGFIDSFLYAYDFSAERGLEQRFAVNTSDYGVVTPRALDVRMEAERVLVTAVGHGSAQSLAVELSPGGGPRLEAIPSLPGATDIVRHGDSLLTSNSLFDAWVVEHAGERRLVREASHDERSWLEKVGEALAVTTLIAPHNRSDAELSRFSCETCHFEGTLDGRTHHTGRGAVKVTTKPLRGLFNNPPYFSRALDRDLTEMVHNEFRVAGARSGTDPWFTLQVSEEPWLALLGSEERELSPALLRRALASHFMLASHAPNARVIPPREWSPNEQAGARIFRERCEGCHEARLVTGDRTSWVPFERWQDFIFSEAGAIVWASERYALTGIEPRVHPLGARIPSLRRVAYKFPYFTNGSSDSLADVLERARFDAECFCHHVGDAPVGSAPQPPVHLASAHVACRSQAGLLRLSAGERRSVLAFLSLL